ncbi:NUDIX hydrolase [Actinomyces capricornis]|uniref:NUDIX hydrolase n=1 Tax=Actinomyces capricornis TaxID=2755559 RepID=A0ABN6K6L3_9ACTO|nr:NUDIX hydrolase [Actinomyces capricornis]
MLGAYHFGVYARIRCNGLLLCVRKTRGPYQGLLDLPGGSPEPFESWHEALRRELHEELGVSSLAIGDFSRFAIHVDRSADGSLIDFHHHGAIAHVRLREDPPSDARSSSDTAGWRWFNPQQDDPSELSRLAAEVGMAE